MTTTLRALVALYAVFCALDVLTTAIGLHVAPHLVGEGETISALLYANLGVMGLVVLKAIVTAVIFAGMEVLHALDARLLALFVGIVVVLYEVALVVSNLHLLLLVAH